MSRVIVKNLPSFITDDKLKEIFKTAGEVTDVQLKYTKKGEFRRFGFIGFRNPEDSERAKQQFHKTFLFTAKIQVLDSYQPGDANKPESWSKYAADSRLKRWRLEEKDKKGKKPKESKPQLDPVEEELNQLLESDPKFKEFYDQRCDGDKKETLLAWSNDPMNTESLLEGKQKEKKEWQKYVDSDHEEIEEDEDDESRTGEEKKKKKKLKVKKFENDIETEGNTTLANTELSDMEYLKQKITKKVEFEEPTSSSDEEGEKVADDSGYKEKRYVLRLTHLKVGINKREVLQFLHPYIPRKAWVSKKYKGVAYAEFATEVEMKRALFKDRSFMELRQIRVVPMEKAVVSEEDKEKMKQLQEREDKWKKQEESVENIEETIGESGSIFARNLPYSATEEDLEELFSKYGPISELSLPVDKVQRKPKGFAVVTYMVPENAVMAYTELDRTIFQGRLLHLLPGKPKPDFDNNINTDNMSYKQKKLLEQKAQSGSSHNWNALFLGSDAVADIMAEKYNVNKADILNPQNNESAAVRLALGETQLVTETRKFLLDNGIALDAFSKPAAKRSKTTILVKNLPANTQVEEIRALFSKYGEIARVVLPPYGITAVVEFMTSTEARTAFQVLAYSNFHHQLLYLEWAPVKVFLNPTSGAETKKKKKKSEGGEEENEKEKEESQHDLKQDENSEEEDFGPEPNTTLFVKDLNLLTNDADFKEFFEKIGPVHYATISKKRDAANGGQLTSLGFGFIQYKLERHAKQALKDLQHAMLDGYAVELKKSNRTLQTDLDTARKQSRATTQQSSKIVVKNVPFQATREELENLFKTFGELKGVRLPIRFGDGRGGHRGFAFVEYISKKDAMRAFEAVCHSTHLYGRRLVLEWSETDDSVETARRKTADHYHQDQPSKRFKSNVLDDLMKMSSTSSL